MHANVAYMQSRRLRALNLSNRHNFEAGYKPLIYHHCAYFAYTLLALVAIPQGSLEFSFY